MYAYFGKNTIIQDRMGSQLGNERNKHLYGSKRFTHFTLFARTFAYSTSCRHHLLQQTQPNRVRSISTWRSYAISDTPLLQLKKSVLCPWGSCNVPTQDFQTLSNLRRHLDIVPAHINTSPWKLERTTSKTLYTSNLQSSTRTSCHFIHNTCFLKL